MQKLKILTLVILLAAAMTVAAGEIHDAAEQGNLEAVRTLLTNDPQLSQQQDVFGNTPLHTAAINGHENVAELLISMGANIDAGDNENSTPLDVGAQNGRERVVRLLVSLGADVNHRDINDMCPILWAASNGNMEIFRLLVEKGADIFARNHIGMTTIHYAAYNGHTDLVNYLLDAGLDINLKKTNGSTPLHGAALDGNMEMIELLVAKGAHINARNEAGYTPFLTAVAGCEKQAAEYFVSLGADPNAELENGQTALIQSVANCRDNEVAMWLIENGADVNAKASDGLSPLLMAAGNGNVEMVRVLLERGAKVDGDNSGFHTPLFFATRQGNADVVDQLIRHGAKVNVKDNEGMTPLILATMNGYNNIVALLVANGAKSNMKEKHYGRTALHLASIRGNAGAVELLSANGADIDGTDNNKDTALNLAAQYGHQDVAKILVTNGAVANRKINASFGPCKMLNEKLADSEAALWYLGNCGYAVKTKNHFLIFDYWNRGSDPVNQCLANGHINPQELANQNVYVFVTHEHADHFDPVIFEWADRLNDITYIYGFRPELIPQYRESGYPGPEYTYMGPRENITIDGMDILTIKANDAGVGFLVKVDGLTLYHAGDHAGWLEGEEVGYTQEIDYLSDHLRTVDIAFLNVTGCHAHGEKPLWEGTCYTIDALSPSMVIPTHAIDREYIYQEYAKKIQNEKYGIQVFCPENRGDKILFCQKETS